jgi:hypothetical protein
MKLRDVPAGRVFKYPDSPARYLKLRNNKYIHPPASASSLTELAGQFGDGAILHCNPENEVILCD